VRRLIPLFLAAALLVTACGDDDDTHAEGSSDQPAGGPLAGRSFVATKVTVDGKPKPLVEGTELSLAFEQGGKLAASAGCNSLFGTAQVADGRIRVSQMGGTDMACDQARMAQETWYGEILSSDPAYSVDGDELTLTAEKTVITFTDALEAHPDFPLEKTVWQLDGFVDGHTASSAPGGASATVQFDAGELAFTNEGCNSGRTQVEVADGSIEVAPMMMTKMACPLAPMEVENKVTAVLDGTVSYVLEGETLTLTKGDHGLTFRVKSPER
jgi:heat shock protein HslJ